jgi:hypothetical protein
MEQASGSAEDWVDIATVNTSVAHSDSSRTSARGAQQPSSSEGAGPLIEELAEVLGELKSYFRWPRAASGFRGFFWGGENTFWWDGEQPEATSVVHEQQVDEAISASQQQEVGQDPSGPAGGSQRCALKPPKQRSQ